MVFKSNLNTASSRSGIRDSLGSATVPAADAISLEKRAMYPDMKPSERRRSRKELNRMLIDAAKNGQAAQTEKLLGEGASKNAVDGYGKSALRFALFSRNLAAAIPILNRKPSAYIIDEAHGFAATDGRKDIVEFLLGNGASPSGKFYGVTIYEAAKVNRQEDIVATYDKWKERHSLERRGLFARLFRRRE